MARWELPSVSGHLLTAGPRVLLQRPVRSLAHSAPCPPALAPRGAPALPRSPQHLPRGSGRALGAPWEGRVQRPGPARWLRRAPGGPRARSQEQLWPLRHLGHEASETPAPASPRRTAGPWRRGAEHEAAGVRWQSRCCPRSQDLSPLLWEGHLGFASEQPSGWGAGRVGYEGAVRGDAQLGGGCTCSVCASLNLTQITASVTAIGSTAHQAAPLQRDSPLPPGLGSLKV